jgi:hypothetical protein
MDHQFEDENVTPVRTEFDATRAYVIFELDAPAGRAVKFIKWLALPFWPRGRRRPG